MKTKLILFSVAVLALVSCQKEIRLQSERIHTIESEPHWEISLSHSVFSFTEPAVEKACVAYNDEIQGLVAGIHAAFVERARTLYAELDSAGIAPAAPFELYLSDSVYIADDKFISVLVRSYEMLGGANGNTDYYALNYDLVTGKFLNLKDLLDLSKADDINALLQKYLQDPDGCYTFEKPTVDNCSAVNLSPESVIFTYGKYILGPGACGEATIAVPRSELSHCLKVGMP